MPLAEKHRAAVAATLDGVLRELLREVVREEVPAIVRAELAALRAETAGSTPAEPGSQYLTIASVAQQMDVAVTTVRRWVSSGALKALSAGHVLRIERGELRRFATAAANDGEATDIDAVAASVLARRKR